LGGRRRPAARAFTAEIRGTWLIVEQHRDTEFASKHLLRLQRPPAIPNLDARPEPTMAVLLHVVGGDDDAAHALGLEAVDGVDDRSEPEHVLPAGHRHGPVVEDLVGDVAVGGDREPDRQPAGVGKRAVAEVLDQVGSVEERRGADPLRAFATHLGIGEHDAGPLGWQARRQSVTSDSGPDERERGCLGAGRVGAARTEPRRSVVDDRHRDQRLAHTSLEPSRVDPFAQHRLERAQQRVRVERARRRNQRLTEVPAMPDDLWLVGRSVEGGSDLVLQQRLALLDDQDRLQAARERPERGRRQWKRHAHLHQADPERMQVAFDPDRP
jgi:hypothetical protein